MGQETSKSWWQTVAGMMTGIAALITALAGLIVALQQTGYIGRSAQKPITANPLASAQSASGPVESRLPPQSVAPHTTLGRTAQPRVDRSGQDFDRKPYSVKLPTKREYVLGNLWAKGRYVLVAANVIPRTPESDTLIIKVRAMAEGQPEYSSDFSSEQFLLSVDEDLIKSDRFFTERNISATRWKETYGSPSRLDLPRRN